MFKHFKELSPSLNKAIQFFTERMDMTQRDREIFYDIIGFAFDEGKIAGKEAFLKDTAQSFKENNQIENQDGD